MEERENAKYGFVYVLGNYCMPGIYKIGATTRSPTQRCKELSSATSCPEDFSLLFYAEVERPFQIEGDLHQEFADCRISKAREFFRLSKEQLDDLELSVSDASLTFCLCEMHSFCHVMHPARDELIRNFIESGYADIQKKDRFEGGI